MEYPRYWTPPLSSILVSYERGLDARYRGVLKLEIHLRGSYTEDRGATLGDPKVSGASRHCRPSPIAYLQPQIQPWCMALREKEREAPRFEQHQHILLSIAGKSEFNAF